MSVSLFYILFLENMGFLLYTLACIWFAIGIGAGIGIHWYALVLVLLLVLRHMQWSSVRPEISVEYFLLPAPITNHWKIWP